MSKTKAAAKTESQTAASDIKWFVYLLRCGNGSLYTGITNDLTRRFNQHNAGTASRYTRSRLPVVLMHQEPQESQSYALKRELAIKALTRPQKESLIRSIVQILQLPVGRRPKRIFRNLGESGGGLIRGKMTAGRFHFAA